MAPDQALTPTPLHKQPLAVFDGMPPENYNLPFLMTQLHRAATGRRCGRSLGWQQAPRPVQYWIVRLEQRGYLCVGGG